jgi:hypothetical protein
VTDEHGFPQRREPTMHWGKECTASNIQSRCEGRGVEGEDSRILTFPAQSWVPLSVSPTPTAVLSKRQIPTFAN